MDRRTAMIKQTKFFHIWNLPKEPTSTVIHNEWESIDQVVLFSGTEYAYERTCGETDELERTVDACNQYNIPVLFLTATYTYNKNLLDWNEDRYKNSTVIDWPYYWLGYMACVLSDANYFLNRDNGNDIRDENLGFNREIEHLYLILVNQPKLHRCIVMDLIAKHNLIEHGAIAWRDVLRQLEETRTEVVSESIQEGVYDWKYWTPEKLSLTENDLFDNSFPNWWILPKHYSHAFMQIVPESSYEVFLISEKTAIPILMNKLFLVAGPKNYHSNLVDMGFKLYDELFDYSFDSIDDMEERYEGLVRNVNKYRDRTPDELAALINSVRDKIEYNSAHALASIRTFPSRWADAVTETNNNEYQEFLTIDNINNLPI